MGIDGVESGKIISCSILSYNKKRIGAAWFSDTSLLISAKTVFCYSVPLGEERRTIV
jgi:hypothetical protein